MDTPEQLSIDSDTDEYMSIDDRWGRALAILLVVIALLGVFVWYGTVTSDPALNHYPSDEDVAPAPAASIGERITLGGEVVATDPVVVAVDHDGGTWTVTLERATAALVRGDEPRPGDELSAYGTLTAQDTLETERATTREPWAKTYMYAISLIGAMWMAGRALAGWRFDPDQLAVVPRDHQRRLTDLLVPSSTTGRARDSEDQAIQSDDADAAGQPPAGGDQDG